MDTQLGKLVDIETDLSAPSDMTDTNNKARDDSNVAAPKDLFTLNDQDDMTRPLEQDNNDDVNLEEETDDLLDDDASTQINLDSDPMDFLDTTVDGETFDDTDDGTSVALDEGDSNGLGPDTNEMNFLGEDMEESILDSPARIHLDTDETQENAAVVDNELEQQQQQESDEEDDTVEKTWDMAGDDVNDDQENSSVDALLDAGEDSFDDDNNINNIDNVINDNTFVVEELAENKVVDDNDFNESIAGGDEDGQHTWNNENVELTSGDDGGDSILQEDSQQTWNNDDDTEAEREEEQEETMEQGTVEESENDRLGATLEHALDALELGQDISPSSSSSPITVDSGNNIVVDGSTRANGLYEVNDDVSLPFDNGELPVDKSVPLPPSQQQQEQTTSIGLDNADDLTSVDTSLVLLIAVFILLCLRLPYVKRFFVKLFKSQESATLPYHTNHSKELD